MKETLTLKFYEVKFSSSDDGGGATPVPIPNTEVKSSSVDGTWRVAAWESRTLLVKKREFDEKSSDSFFLRKCFVKRNIWRRYGSREAKLY